MKTFLHSVNLHSVNLHSVILHSVILSGAILRGALLAFAATSLAAQTTGVPGINDLRVMGLGTSTTSCNALGVVLTTPGVLTFDVSCRANTFGVIAISPACFGGCAGIPLFPASACGLPAGCFGTDLMWSLGPVIATVSFASDALGDSHIAIPVPSVAPGCAAAQAIIHDPCSAFFGLLASQAHTFCWV